MDSISLQKPNNDQKVDGDGDFLFGEEVIYGSMLPMVLRAVIKLNVLEIMNKAPTTNLSAYQIASQIPNNKNPDAHIMLDRILGFLACHSVLTCTTQLSNAGKVERLYGLSPACNCFLENNEDGASLSRLLLFVHSERAQECWLYLDEVVLQPNFSAMEKVYGAKSYDHLATDVSESELFNKATSDHTTIVMRRILDKYKGFENVKVVVDVGGGIGTNINMIVSKYPTIKGINFDLPHVVDTALSYPGVEHVGGDMFASVPKGDAIFMKWVFNNWSDQECLTLLKNCYEALPDGGKVIIVEKILPSIPAANNSARTTYAFDLNLMVITPKSRERSKEEFEVLAKSSGFIGFSLICNACNYWVIEFLK
ncbi:hypothetical protein Scep_001003 [Stephania cephalantha]|uniref:Uncharacterized protein n=1 Tax=Stephania cephalantha TaxID=152367 RepID=A0AAP0L8N0_9MAGN